MFNRFRRASNYFLRLSMPGSQSYSSHSSDSNTKLYGVAAVSMLLGAAILHNNQ